MQKEIEEYYVYVYIDPRNFEEFYYGKGKGNRKEAHLKDTSDSEKVKRIKAIQKEGLHPIIRVIAKDLTEREAFLVEKTLIWKLGKNLTNKSSGKFASKFRPHMTMYKDDLPEFDFRNGIYYVNVGEGNDNFRSWNDCIKYGFISAGQDKKWSDPLKTFNKGDVVIVYLKGYGYVGVGTVLGTATPAKQFAVKDVPLQQLSLQSTGLLNNLEDLEKCEYFVPIVWKKVFKKEEAKWKTKSNLFTTQLIKASLESQAQTLRFVEEGFGLKLSEL